MNFIYRPSSETGPIQWNWITLIGPDVQDFLHRLTTVHVKALAAGQSSLGCFLTPQGKIRAYFTLWNLRPQEYAFEFDAGSTGKWKKELLAVIDQYTFAEKMTLQEGSQENECIWAFADQAGLKSLGAENLQAKQTLVLIPPETGEVRICHQGEADYGRVWLTLWGSKTWVQKWLHSSLSQTQEVTFSEIERWRVQALRPRVDTEITETSIPLEVGLRDAIADHKGCYPGQEVIEKVLSLGAPAKRLTRIEGEGAAPEPGEKILSTTEPPTEVGQVTSSSSKDGKFVILGFVKKMHAKEGLAVQFSEKRSSKGAIVQIAPYA